MELHLLLATKGTSMIDGRTGWKDCVLERGMYGEDGVGEGWTDFDQMCCELQDQVNLSSSSSTGRWRGGIEYSDTASPGTDGFLGEIQSPDPR